jgi:putative membrane protein
MILDAALAFFHFAAIFLTVAFLATSMALCRGPLSGAAIVRLGRIDLVYFICAMLALATGLLRVFFGAKGYAFYLHNPFFFAKVGVFMLIGLVSVYPTIRFIQWRKAAEGEATYTVPAAEIAGVRKFIHAEFGLLILLPLLAALMSRGIGA